MVPSLVEAFKVTQRGGAPEFSGEMLGWVLSAFSVGSQNMNIFQKVDKNNFQQIGEEDAEKKQKKESSLSMGARLGSQWVLSGYSVSTQGTHGYSDCASLSTQGVLR